VAERIILADGLTSDDCNQHVAPVRATAAEKIPRRRAAAQLAYDLVSIAEQVQIRRPIDRLTRLRFFSVDHETAHNQTQMREPCRESPS
jgi:hypothetical protein